MSRNVWIINEYAGSPYHGMELRHYYIAKKLKERGYNPVIITASFSHLLTSPVEFKDSYKIDAINGIKYLWIKVLRYKGGSDKKRILKWLMFSYKLFFVSKLVEDNILEKPNFIIASTPEIFHLVPAYKLARKFSSKFIYEVRDIWPLSLVELSNLSYKNPIIYLMDKVEKFTYQKADYVVSLLPNFKLYLEENNISVRNFKIIPNGICLEEYKEVEPLPDEILKRIQRDKFLVVYTGTFGKANALDHLIKAAKLLKHKNEIHFLLVGKGEEENNLKQLAKGLKNITFLPPVSKKQVQSILKFADVCYIGWRKKKLYKYGISANKIFDYLYSGKPILHSYSGAGDLISFARAGISVEAENPEAIKKGILKFFEMPKEDRIKMGKRGKEYVLQHHTYENLVDKWEEVFNESY